MKTLYFLICILSTLVSQNITFSQNYNFEFMKTPNGSEFELGDINVYNIHTLLIGQAYTHLTDLQKLYISTNRGRSWYEKDKYIILAKHSVILSARSEVLYIAPMGFSTWYDIPIYSNGLWFNKNLDIYWWIRTEGWDGFFSPSILNPQMIYTKNHEFWFASGTYLYWTPNDGDSAHWGGGIANTTDFAIAEDSLNSKILVCDSYWGMTCIPCTDKYEDSLSRKTRFSHLAVNKYGDYYGYNYKGEMSVGVHLSEDGGRKWKLIKAVDSLKKINGLHVFGDALILASEEGMEVTYNKGKTWYKVKLPDNGTSDSSIRNIEINSSNGEIFAVYGNFFLIRGVVNGVSVNEETVQKPELTDMLGLNVDIKVFDILGLPVVDEKDYKFNGIKELELDFDFPVGVYFLQLNALGEAVTHKFIKYE